MGRKPKKDQKSKSKLCLVCSSGGHFHQLSQLKDWWGSRERFWVTFNRSDTKELFNKENGYFAYFPENRNPVNAFRNFFLAIYILRKERPDIIFSTGAGIAPPFFLAGKLLGIKLIYLETASYIGLPTLSGKMVHALSDVFLVQHESSKKFYPKAQVHGGLV